MAKARLNEIVTLPGAEGFWRVTVLGDEGQPIQFAPIATKAALAELDEQRRLSHLCHVAVLVQQGKALEAQGYLG